MKLTVVGCSGSAPGPKSAASCYLVEHDGFRLVLDLGNGAFGALQAVADPASVDAVFLSHLHADHCLDVAPFVVWHRYSGRATKEQVPLYAPVAAERRLALAYDSDGDGITDVFDFVPVGPGSFVLGPFDVTLARTAHPIECYAIRLTAGGGHWSTPVTRARASRSSSSRAGPTCCWPRRLIRRAATCRQGCTSPVGRPASTPPPPASAGCCSPTSPPGWTRSGSSSPPARCSPRPNWCARAPPTRSSRTSCPARREGPRRAAVICACLARRCRAPWPRGGRGARRRPADQPGRTAG
ncbi:MBL fold metallo-hydrolase [Blastococcus brunescens]|uniref:MBL fold metallo-hydrolase n=1 Tax=Blastococcus brunescens TaxID=1564165 RepID=A0ABZ1B312_9ACTN|nr:MBL fold metallo-hydrolase [Blastococcus sp. BMG 8361]WRL65188.1 MBL fold metallo-hydrolase [Blastococcus sp. BMG 8361]